MEGDPFELTESMLPALASQASSNPEEETFSFEIPGCKYPLSIHPVEEGEPYECEWKIFADPKGSVLVRAALQTCSQGAGLTFFTWKKRLLEFGKIISCLTSMQNIIENLEPAILSSRQKSKA